MKRLTSFTKGEITIRSIVIIMIIIFLFSFTSGCIVDIEKSRFLGTWLSSDDIEKYEFTFYKNNYFER
jgi:hypothetical protein